MRPEPPSRFLPFADKTRDIKRKNAAFLSKKNALFLGASLGGILAETRP